MKTPVIVAVKAIPCGRYHDRADSPYAGRKEAEILGQLALECLAEAGVEAKDLGTLALTASTPNARQLGMSSFLAGYLGMPGSGSVSEVQCGGLTGGLAFDRACDDIRLGRTRAALALGLVFDTRVNPHEVAERGIRVTGDAEYHSPYALTPISWYALDGARYMHEHQVTRETIAAVAVKNRIHAVSNPLAQYRDPLDTETVLAEPPVVAPFGRLEISPRSDGAIALLVISEEVARDMKIPYTRVRGRGFYHDGSYQISGRICDTTDYASITRAADDALNEAGLTNADIDLWELYAPLTIVEVLASEALGLFARGQGAAAAADGQTSIGGTYPMCTSGGCLSRGHPPALSAMYGLAELHMQLQQRAGARQVVDAQLGLASCEMGKYNAALVHVLERGA